VDLRWVPILGNLHQELIKVLPDYHLIINLSGGMLGAYLNETCWSLPCCLTDHHHATSPDHDAALTRQHALAERASRLVKRAEARCRYTSEPLRVPPTNSRPVVALDIDGALNILSDGKNLIAYPVRIPAGTVDSPFLRGQGRTDLDVTVHVDPTVINWINDLILRKVDVVWATTWEQAARSVFACAVGLVDFPVGVSVALHPPRFSYVKHGDAAAWKAEALRERFGGRPLVWIDDMAQSYERSVWRHPDDEDTLVVVCDGTTGITPAQIVNIEELLSRYAVPKRTSEHARAT
jgi:hypothetical protein